MYGQKVYAPLTFQYHVFRQPEREKGEIDCYYLKGPINQKRKGVPKDENPSRHYMYGRLPPPCHSPNDVTKGYQPLSVSPSAVLLYLALKARHNSSIATCTSLQNLPTDLERDRGSSLFFLPYFPIFLRVPMLNKIFK